MRISQPVFCMMLCTYTDSTFDVLFYLYNILSFFHYRCSVFINGNVLLNNTPHSKRSMNLSELYVCIKLFIWIFWGHFCNVIFFKTSEILWDFGCFWNIFLILGIFEGYFLSVHSTTSQRATYVFLQLSMAIFVYTNGRTVYVYTQYSFPIH